jgi:prepilin-type N-terminal cleavage/methylation domain-containing protein
MGARGRTGRRGFTLVECIAAVVVISISVPPMTWALRQAHKHRVDAIQASRARWLASEKLEDVIADRHCLGYTSLVAGNYPAEAAVTGSPGFSRAVSFAETGVNLSSAGTGYMRATVTVTYTGGNGFAQSVSLSTILTDYTP